MACLSFILTCWRSYLSFTAILSFLSVIFRLLWRPTCHFPTFWRSYLSFSIILAFFYFALLEFLTVIYRNFAIPIIFRHLRRPTCHFPPFWRSYLSFSVFLASNLSFPLRYLSTCHFPASWRPYLSFSAILASISSSLWTVNSFSLPSLI